MLNEFEILINNSDFFDEEKNSLDEKFIEILGKNDEEYFQKIFNFIDIISTLENNNKISIEKNEILNHKLKYEVNFILLISL